MMPFIPPFGSFLSPKGICLHTYETLLADNGPKMIITCHRCATLKEKPTSCVPNKNTCVIMQCF